ncbi:MAG: hypothetical protein WCI05_05855 [Myxococcales bacterium]
MAAVKSPWRRGLLVALPFALLALFISWKCTRLVVSGGRVAEPVAAEPPLGGGPGGPLAPGAPLASAKQARPGLEPNPPEGAGPYPSHLPMMRPPGGGQPVVPRTTWEKRLAMAQRTLDAYRESTKYPPLSRPMSDKPDLVRPHAVSPSTLPLWNADGGVSMSKVTVTQDRYFVAGSESVLFNLRCEDKEGKPQACDVGVAVARPTVSVDAGVEPRAELTFTDDGRGADTAAGDLVYSASFAPASAEFASYFGAIKVAIPMRTGGEDGFTTAQVTFSPDVPALFTRRVREVVEGGSLQFYIQIEVSTPGRYMLAARVDDANGKSFAYVQFGDELKAGVQEARLTLFGKLIKDSNPAQPVKLRDLEGYMLLENAHPDRKLVPTVEGVFYTAKTYPMGSFSDDEWQSDERQRHLDRYGQDAAEAEQRVLQERAPAVAAP